jgi:hypothetical protein
VKLLSLSITTLALTISAHSVASNAEFDAAIQAAPMDKTVIKAKGRGSEKMGYYGIERTFVKAVVEQKDEEFGWHQFKSFDKGDKYQSYALKNVILDDDFMSTWKTGGTNAANWGVGYLTYDGQYPMFMFDLTKIDKKESFKTTLSKDINTAGLSYVMVDYDSSQLNVPNLANACILDFTFSIDTKTKNLSSKKNCLSQEEKAASSPFPNRKIVNVGNIDELSLTASYDFIGHTLAGIANLLVNPQVQFISLDALTIWKITDLQLAKSRLIGNSIPLFNGDIPYGVVTLNNENHATIHLSETNARGKGLKQNLHWSLTDNNELVFKNDEHQFVLHDVNTTQSEQLGALITSAQVYGLEGMTVPTFESFNIEKHADLAFKNDSLTLQLALPDSMTVNGEQTYSQKLYDSETADVVNFKLNKKGQNISHIITQADGTKAALISGVNASAGYWYLLPQQ